MSTEKAGESNRKPKLLLQQSDGRFRQALVELLQPHFLVYEVGASAEAERLAQQHTFDLAVSDRLLPGEIPTVLLGELDHSQIAVGIEHNIIARYVLPPFSAQNVATIVLDAWMNVENERQRAMQFDWLREFISLLSHDVRNLAAGIMGVLELMSNGQLAPDGAEYTEFVQMGYQNSQGLLTTLSNVVDLSRLLTGERELTISRFDVNDSIAFALNQVHHTTEERQIAIDVDSGPWRISGDQYLIQCALVALLSYMLRATHRGDKVTLKVESDVSLGCPALSVVIGNGARPIIPGGGERIPPPHTPFPTVSVRQERFVTLDRLDIGFSNQVALAHGGYLTLASQPAGGNTISFTLPEDSASDHEEI